MKKNDTYRILGEIKKVSAPPMLNNIEAKIKAIEADKMSFGWSVAASFLIICLLSSTIYSISIKGSYSKTKEYAKEKNTISWR